MKNIRVSLCLCLFGVSVSAFAQDSKKKGGFSPTMNVARVFAPFRPPMAPNSARSGGGSSPNGTTSTSGKIGMSTGTSVTPTVFSNLRQDYNTIYVDDPNVGNGFNTTDDFTSLALNGVLAHHNGVNNSFPLRLQGDQFLFNGAAIDVMPNFPTSSNAINYALQDIGSINLTASVVTQNPGAAYESDQAAITSSGAMDGTAFNLALFNGVYDENGLIEGETKWRRLFAVTKQGDVRLGDPYDRSSYPGVTGNESVAGTRLFFSGGDKIGTSWDNDDPIFIHRFNYSTYEKSALRVCLGDDGSAITGTTPDKLQVGYYTSAGVWHPGAALYSTGEIYAIKVVVKADAASFPDYVFKPSYRLRSLQEVEQAIQTDGHLPGMPSAAEVEAKGMDLGEQNRLLVEKVEELTLYLIQMRKELDDLKAAQK